MIRKVSLLVFMLKHACRLADSSGGGRQSCTDDTIRCDATKLALTRTSGYASDTHPGSYFCVM